MCLYFLSPERDLLVLSMAEDDDDTTQQPSPNKHPRIDEEEELEMDEHHQSSSTNLVLYWPNSPEARQVFQFTSSGRSVNSRRKRGSSSPAPVGDNAPEYETAKEALQRRIRLLQSANESEGGWRNVILGRGVDIYCTNARDSTDSTAISVFKMCISVGTIQHEQSHMA
jgi:hypothetical protein